jgi:hypothetical protein
MAQKQNPATVRITAILPGELYARLGHAAVDDRLPATEIVRLALTEYLDRRDKARTRRPR